MHVYAQVYGYDWLTSSTHDALGVKNSGILTRAFCHRLQFFFDQHKHSLEPAIGEDAALGYVEPAEFKLLADSCDLSPELRARVRVIRGLCV